MLLECSMYLTLPHLPWSLSKASDSFLSGLPKLHSQVTGWLGTREYSYRLRKQLCITWIQKGTLQFIVSWKALRKQSHQLLPGVCRLSLSLLPPDTCANFFILSEKKESLTKSMVGDPPYTSAVPLVPLTSDSLMQSVSHPKLIGKKSSAEFQWVSPHEAHTAQLCAQDRGTCHFPTILALTQASPAQLTTQTWRNGVELALLHFLWEAGLKFIALILLIYSLCKIKVMWLHGYLC
jgi:hypothetical protein